MRIRGRRHWTETVALYTVTHTTSGVNTGARTPALVKNDVPATVQPVSDAELIRHGLSTSRPVYWCRYAHPAALRVDDEIVWNGGTHRIIATSRGLDIDEQVMMELQA